ncbi:15638_t:CDS:2, partial [Entrophospora sp. SA101]
SIINFIMQVDPNNQAESEQECDEELEAKLAHFFELKDKGVHFNDHLLKNKAFRNPHIYDKLVEFVHLDEIGSNFDREVYDPYGFPAEAYADQLEYDMYFYFKAATQKKVAEEREAAKKQQQRSQLAFVTRHVMQSLAARAEK